MSLGFGMVPPDAWDAVKAGNRDDEVAAGDYFARFVGVKHFDAAKSKKGTGTYSFSFRLTKRNSAEHVDKQVSMRCNYSNDTDSANLVTMNAISASKMANLVAACPGGESKIVLTNGHYDTVATLEMLAKMEHEVLISVEHRTVDGKRYQDVSGVKPVTVG